MSRKVTLPPEFNVSKIREDAKWKWRHNRLKSVTTLERIHRSRPSWLYLIFAAIFMLSASHTVNAFQSVINVWINLSDNIHIPLGSVGVVAIEFGLLWAAFGRYETKQTGGRKDAIVFTMEIVFFISTILINGTGSLTVLSDQHLVGGVDDLKIIGGLVMVAISALVVPLSLDIVGTGLAKLVYERKDEGDRFAPDWLREGPDVLHLAFNDELLKLGKSTAEANRLATQLVKTTFTTVTIKATPVKENQKGRKTPESTGTEPEEQPRAKLPTKQVIERLHKEHPGFPALPLQDQVNLVTAESGRSESTVYEIVGKYRAMIAAQGTPASSNGVNHNQAVQ